MILDYIILKDGLPIYTRNLDAQQGVTADQAKFTLISGFLSAISTFANSMEHLGQMQEVQMTSEIYFTFKKTQNADSEILFIVVSNGNTPKICVKELINNSAEQFLCEFGEDLNLKWKGKLNSFDRFNDIFDIILRDVNNHIASLNQPTQILPGGNENMEVESESKTKTEKHEVTLTPEPTIIQAPVINSSSNIMPIIAANSEEPINQNNSESAGNSMKSSSSRFDRYMHYQQMAVQSTVPNIGIAKEQTIQDESDSVTSAPWSSPDAWITKSTTRIENPQEPPVINTSKSQFQSRFQNNSQSRIIRQTPSVAKPESQIITHNGTRFVFRQPEGRTESYAAQFYAQSNALKQHHYRVSVYEKIPCLHMRFAGQSESFFADPWYKAVYNAVNNQNSIREIANKFRITPAEVLRACQDMAQSGLIYFQD